MNWAHFTAFVWLRWRLIVNQWRRAGALSAALMVIVTVGAIITAVPLLIGSYALGVFLIPKAQPAYLMYAWDGLIFAFLLFWGIGLVTELQRNDPLSLSKFLHLPVSVNSAFLINFFSSLIRLSLACFVPIMLGFAAALVAVQGVRQLTVLFMVPAFLLMITGPTYQFQGWLASLMNNPRRRRTVVVGTTMAFVLVFQLPNLVNLYFTPKYAERQNARIMAQQAEQLKLQQAAQTKEIDSQEFMRRQNQLLERYAAESKRHSAEEAARWQNTIRIANMVVPLGWLPMGVVSSAEGQVLPSLLGLAGMTLIGSFSLWRAYRSTLAQFQGSSSNRKDKAPVPRAEDGKIPGNRMLEARLPGLSEPVSAIALAGFRSLLRSPEAKMALLMPPIMGGVFGTMLFQVGGKVPELLRPLIGFGAMACVLLSLVQVMGNQFGIDRDGFRVFVLCSAPRRDILLGKNLAFVPPAFLLSAILLVVVQFISPMRVDLALSMVPQMISMFLLFAALANLCSIYTPVFIAPGSLKPANPKATTILLQLLMVFFLFPLGQAVTLIPIGVEAALTLNGLAVGWPICLLLAIAECAVILLLYRLSLGWLGSLLQDREQTILETVTNRAM